jgi:hypothetical protein
MNAYFGETVMTDQQLPPLFSTKGVFQDLTPNVFDSLSDDVRAAYENVRNIAADLKVADNVAAEAAQRVTTCAAAVVEIENYCRKNFPKRTQFDLWKETFGTPKA